MKLTKSRAMQAVEEVLGWRVKPEQVREVYPGEMPIYEIPVGKVLVEVGEAASAAGLPYGSRPERYGRRTVIYIELRLPDLAMERLDTRFFFLDSVGGTLEEAQAREEYHRRMDAIDLCEGFACFDAEAARDVVKRHERKYAMQEEMKPLCGFVQVEDENKGGR